LLESTAETATTSLDATTFPLPHDPSSSDQLPPWLPINPGEQLRNLVGRWRILQRVASHRWTTDDLVTAYIAVSAFVPSLSRSNDRNDSPDRDFGNDNAEGKKRTIRYLDLGTGNSSVLQMATRYVPSRLERSRYDLEAVGVEARRSLSFNPGTRRARREGTQQRY